MGTDGFGLVQRERKRKIERGCLICVHCSMWVGMDGAVHRGGMEDMGYEREKEISFCGLEWIPSFV